jgi:PAS domain S-box-containing protein
MSVCRILIVEDEAIVAMDLEGRLARMDYQPLGRVSSGEEALAFAGEHRPDLVLMDIRLQGKMDGIEAADEIRRRFHLPVIFLTAYSEDATLDRAKLTEPFGYILKPIDDRELKSTIEIALYKHRADEEVRRLKCLFEMHWQVDQAAVRLRAPEELLSAVCRAAVESGTMDLAWIGYLDPVTSRILPVAQFGKHSGILSHREFYAGDRLEGHHVLGKSILEGQPFVCNSPRESFCLCSPEQPPGSMPFQSCASLPIRFQGKVYYVLTLCTAEREFFQEREVRLLEEVALDISYALDKMEDDSQREAYSERCRSQPEFFQALLDAMPLPAFYKDVRLRYLGCNKAFEGLLGMSRDQLIGRTTHELWPLDLAKTYRGADQELLMSSLPQVYDAAVVKPDGTRTPVRFYKSTFNDPDGTLGGIIGIVEDLTERKRAEQALLDREETVRGQLEK